MKNGINDNILSLISRTPDSLMLGIAERVKLRRLEKGWTQNMLAAKSGVSLASYRRFESSGEMSLRSLVMLAFALDMTDEFEALFNSKTYQSIDDILRAGQLKQRKRGSQMRNAGWTYIFLDGSRISCRCCGMTPRRSAKRSARLC